MTPYDDIRRMAAEGIIPDDPLDAYRVGYLTGLNETCDLFADDLIPLMTLEEQIVQQMYHLDQLKARRTG